MKDLKEFRYPKDINEAIRILHDGDGKAKIIAGGTSLTTLKGKGVKTLVDISRLGLDDITEVKEGLSIGACATAYMLSEAQELTRPGVRALQEASMTAGPHGVRTALTIGGNVAQCFPWSDLPVPLLVLGAKVKTVGKNPREIEISQLLERHPSKILEYDEFIKEFILPIDKEPSETTGSAFIKISRTKNDDGLATAAAWVKGVAPQGSEFEIKDLRVAIGSVRSLPVLIEGIEPLWKKSDVSDEKWIEKIGDEVLSQVGPIADIRASSEYRNRLIKTASMRAVGLAVKRAIEE